MADAAVEFLALASALKEAGETGLRNELYKAISDAAQPLVRDIGNVTHLRADMPDRYADVLAKDLKVSVYRRTAGEEPGATLVGRAPTFGRGGRKVAQRNRGLITHPLFGNRKRWYEQTGGMRPGFFDDPVERSGPEVRNQIEAAVRRVRDKIYAAP